MRHLLLVILSQLAYWVALAETGDESPGIPCPFASRFVSADWSDITDNDTMDDRIRKMHQYYSESQDVRDVFEDGISGAAEVANALRHQNVPDTDIRDNMEDVGRILKRNKGSEPRTGGRMKKTTKKHGTSSSRQKKETNKRTKSTNKRNKKTKKRGKKTNKRGKRTTGLGSSAPNRCFSNSTYDSIDNDIALLKKAIRDSVTRSHFLGGIVRLAAHDFMDYDKRDRSNLMGSDGCFDETHPTNKGLPESVWCKNCLLRKLYEERYSSLSRADFWIAAANAVIRQTSENNALDLKDTFRWGRKDKAMCRHSADRLPEATGCKEVESAFLTRMGLEWRDAVALLGAHSLGRASADFSGHEGTWVDTAVDAQVFDKQYYEELVFNAWRPRDVGSDTQDFTTGNNKRNQRVMLNTDICLVFDIDDDIECCTKTDEFFQGGQSKCIDDSLRQCPLYRKGDPRWQATNAVVEYIGGTKGSKKNDNFYAAFSEAWKKATMNGWNDLKELSEDCDSSE